MDRRELAATAASIAVHAACWVAFFSRHTISAVARRLITRGAAR